MDGRATMALLGALPDSGTWTAEERVRWLRAVEAMVDLYIRLDETPEPAEGEQPA